MGGEIEYTFTPSGKEAYGRFKDWGFRYKGDKPVHSEKMALELLIWLGDNGLETVSRDKVFIEHGGRGLSQLSVLEKSGYLERLG